MHDGRATSDAGGDTDCSSSPGTPNLGRSSANASLPGFEPMAAAFLREGGLLQSTTSDQSRAWSSSSGSGSLTRMGGRLSLPLQPQLSAALLAAKAVGSPHASRVRPIP